MTRTLLVIEERVNEAMDHLTAALEPVDWRDRPGHIKAAMRCFMACAWALSAEMERSEERR